MSEDIGGAGGACKAGAGVDCNDDNPCTEDSCDPATGCSHTTIDCDDSDACTIDSCDVSAG